MTQRMDLSIGQRLALGFGLLLLVFLVVLALVGSWHRQSAEVQEHYSVRIQPLQERLRDLDRGIYKVGLLARSVLISAEPERLQAFEAGMAEARVAAEVLARSPTGTVEPEVRGRAVLAARRYLDAAATLVERARQGPLAVSAEEPITRLRDLYLQRSDEYGGLQAEHGALALAELAELRGQTGSGLVALAVLGSIVLLLFSWITARSVSRPAAELLRSVEAIEGGDWRLALELSHDPRAASARRDEMARLARAFGGAALALEQREQRLLADGRVAQAVSSSLDRDPVAQAALDRIVEHTGAELGVLYTCPADDARLVPAAGHAAGQLPVLHFGEGIPGQAAQSRTRVVVEGMPADAGFTVKLGFDQAPARHAVAVPVLFADQLLGVLVLASLKPFGSEVLAFLDAAAGQLGIGLRNVTTYEEMQLLLARVRESNERVQAQNEELQVQNEEIQAQNEEIRAQGQQLESQNEELLQQREELRRQAALLLDADERKNAFLGVLAHELRNPMAAIGNGLYVLQRGLDDSEGAPRRALEIIERQSRHLVRLIDDLLDVTRISQGKIQIQRETLDLSGVVSECVDDLSIACQQAGIRLEVALADDPICVEGDRTRLCQVLGNLLANSVKFSSRGKVVRVQLSQDAATRQAVLRVEDEGEGIDPDVLARLFQPFSQGESGLDRGKGGLGLGLALVKALVQLHGGTVRAESEGLGKGARFTVRLPLAGGEPQRAVVAARGDQASAEALLAGTRVLVIEDNADAASSLEEALRLAGCEVALARTGPEGVRRATELQPDVVLCDIGLPISDGYQVARELRARTDTAGVLLIALTGYASAEDRQRAGAAGFDHHIAKPLDMGTFARLLARRSTTA